MTKRKTKTPLHLLSVEEKRKLTPKQIERRMKQEMEDRLRSETGEMKVLHARYKKGN